MVSRAVKYAIFKPFARIVKMKATLHRGRSREKFVNDRLYDWCNHQAFIPIIDINHGSKCSPLT